MKSASFICLCTAAALVFVGNASIHAHSGSLQSQQADPVPSQSADQGSSSSSNQSSGQSQGIGSGQGRGSRGFGSGPGGARGMLGTVTEVAADHYTIKNDSGETYIVHFSTNTRIMKQPAGRNRQNGQNTQISSPSESTGNDQAERTPPVPLKPTDIKVGDVITAAGEVDSANKSVGAMFIAQVDPERAKQMRTMQANYGKTWLAGRITAIDGTRITIEGMIDHATHAVDVDENTSFRQRRDSITLADIKPGEQLRAEGAIKDGVFLATTINAMAAQERDPNRTQANRPAAPPPQ